MNKKWLFAALPVLFIFIYVAVILTSVDKKKPPKLKRPAEIKGRIAIVIDDWGYNLDNLAAVQEIKQPLTCAVLPNLKNSSLLAQRLNASGLEVILHLPSEPKEKYPLEKDTITVEMDAERIRAIIARDLDSVSPARGINNHMGSRVTEDTRTSEIIISEAKKRKLYFLDSFVTAKSVCPDLARKLKARFAKRDVFLDNRSDPSYIKGQVLKLKDIAKKRGYAVGIGHARKNTILVLKEMIPELLKSGYKLVFVSEIVK